MKEKSIVGELINFRGLVYSPVNENGVVFLFGKVVEDLNMYVEEITPGFPDCIGRRFTGKGWERVNIEFEYKSSNFQAHGHDPRNCDIIVCWEHDWRECPIEVIPLRDVIKSFPNKTIPPSDVKEPEPENLTLEDLYKRNKVIDSVKNLFQSFDKEVKNIDEKIWLKIGKTAVTYYSPERVFVYTWFRKRSITLDLFTKGGEIKGVKNYGPSRDGAPSRWGSISLTNESDLPKVLDAVRMSYEFIKEAIKNNEYIGWYAKIEEHKELL